MVMPIIIGVFSLSAMRAQDVPDWQMAAGGKMAFAIESLIQED